MATEIRGNTWVGSELWDARKKMLERTCDPVEKFKLFDQITNEALGSVSFAVLKKLAKDPTFSQCARESYFTLVVLRFQYISDILTIVQRCIQLSEETIKPYVEESRLWSICHHPKTYIQAKIFQMLYRTILTENFANSSRQGHPLYSLNEKMWELQSFNHGSNCPCYAQVCDRSNT